MADKIVLNSALGAYDITQLNNNFSKIASTLNDKVLYRDNPFGTPNYIKSDIDMNGFRILNLATPGTDNEPARLKDVANAVAGLAAQTANLVHFDPADDISATTVQGAVVEVNNALMDYGVSVKRYGAKGDGVTDDTAAIQAALDSSVGVAISKVVLFPPGQYIVNGTLTINSKVSMVGVGNGAVRIKQTHASATLLKSASFDSLTGTSNSGGVRRVHISNITFEATTGATTQHGIQIYGYGNVFENIHIRGFGGYGLNTEWATPGTTPDSGYDDGFTENRYYGLKVYECGLSGIKCAGPHDGQWFGVISYSNNLQDTSTDKPNVWITSKGNPQYIDQLHAWGNTSNVAMLLEGSALMSNCALEGAVVAQLKIKTGEVSFKGGQIFAAGSSSSIGIQFVGGTSVCIGYDIDTVIENDNGGSIDFGTGIDSFKINVRVYQTTGTVMLGTIPTTGVGKSLKVLCGGGANNRATTQQEYSLTATNLSLTGSGDTGFGYADHAGEGVLSMPQRKTEPGATYYPASGVVAYGRVNGIRVHQSSSNTIGTLMGEPTSTLTPADNLDLSFYQLNTLAASASPVTINNFVGGLNGHPVYVLLPSGGATVTIGIAGNIKTKTGAAIASGASKQLLSFVKARDGNYYQV